MAKSRTTELTASDWLLVNAQPVVINPLVHRRGPAEKLLNLEQRGFLLLADSFRERVVQNAVEEDLPPRLFFTITDLLRMGTDAEFDRFLPEEAVTLSAGVLGEFMSEAIADASGNLLSAKRLIFKVGANDVAWYSLVRHHPTLQACPFDRHQWPAGTQIVQLIDARPRG